MEIQIKVLQRLYVVFGIVFVSLLFIHPYPGSFILKPLPVLIMAYLCWRYLKGPQRILMVLGFIFSAAGDVFLDLDRTLFFKQGLLSFLLTQILYSIAFFKEREFSRQRLLAASAVCLYSLVMILLLWDHLGTLRIPVLVYILALTTMGVSAALRKGPLSGVYFGGFLFVIADSLIAISKFLYPFEYSLIVIITLYLCGQFLIGKGVLETRQLSRT